MNTNNFETLRISDQVRRAFFGDAWHGPALRELLDGVDFGRAAGHPLAFGHSIWQLVVHIDFWASAALGASQGTAMPRTDATEGQWPEIADCSADAWALAREHLFQTGDRLAKAIEGFDDARLKDIVPGRDYDFYYLFHGIAQHSLYHGGQIAMLKKTT